MANNKPRDTKSKLKDSLKKSKSIVFHSTRSRQELADIILNNNFKAGTVGGAMLGAGFYANQHLYQAQKGNYGQYIVKAEVTGIAQFLILDKEQYEEFHGAFDGDFIRKQLDDRGLQHVRFNNNPGNSSQIAISLHSNYFKDIYKKFYGFTYTGGHDRESIVCWYPHRCIRAIEFSTDKGATWEPLKNAEDVLTDDKNANLNKHEDVRSLQRAKDLIDRYEKYDDAKLANAMNSQIKRIQDPAKKEVRRDIFKKGLAKWRPDALVEFEKLGDSVSKRSVSELLKEDRLMLHEFYKVKQSNKFDESKWKWDGDSDLYIRIKDSSNKKYALQRKRDKKYLKEEIPTGGTNARNQGVKRTFTSNIKEALLMTFDTAYDLGREIGKNTYYVQNVDKVEDSKKCKTPEELALTNDMVESVKSMKSIGYDKSYVVESWIDLYPKEFIEKAIDLVKIEDTSYRESGNEIIELVPYSKATSLKNLTPLEEEVLEYYEDYFEDGDEVQLEITGIAENGNYLVPDYLDGGSSEFPKRFAKVVEVVDSVPVKVLCRRLSILGIDHFLTEKEKRIHIACSKAVLKASSPLIYELLIGKDKNPKVIKDSKSVVTTFTLHRIQNK